MTRKLTLPDIADLRASERERPEFRTQLALTRFIELTSELALHDWLPRPVGIEEHLELRIGTDDPVVVPCIPDEEHQEQLTRASCSPTSRIAAGPAGPSESSGSTSSWGYET